MPREIITLQIGTSANYVGSHFWNAQVGYHQAIENWFGRKPSLSMAREKHRRAMWITMFCFDLAWIQRLFWLLVPCVAVLCHQGEETFTPRLVLFELKGTLSMLYITLWLTNQQSERFGTLKKLSDLYDTESSGNDQSTWYLLLLNWRVIWHSNPYREGKTHFIHQERPRKNEYLEHLSRSASDLTLVSLFPTIHLLIHDMQDQPLTFSDKLEKSVQYWSDYNRLYYHPRSIVEFPHILHKENEEPLSFYRNGEELMQSMPELVSLVGSLVLFMR